MFVAPVTMRLSPDIQQHLVPFDLKGPDWSLKIADGSPSPNLAVTADFDWSTSVIQAASGTRELRRAATTLAGLPGWRLDWRDDDVNRLGFDVILGRLEGKPFKFTCHGPAESWQAVQPVCERMAASIQITGIAAANPPPAAPPPMPPVAPPKPPAPTTSVVPPPPVTPPVTNLPAPATSVVVPPPANKPPVPPKTVDGPSPAAPSLPDFAAWGTATLIGLGVALVAGALGLAFFVVALWRRTPASNTAKLAQPGNLATAQAKASVEAGPLDKPRFCTQCGAKLAFAGTCPQCGAANEALPADPSNELSRAATEPRATPGSPATGVPASSGVSAGYRRLILGLAGAGLLLAVLASYLALGR
jgi:hypothetical protein